MGLYDFTIYDMITRNAFNYSKKIAWYEVDEDREISFMDYKMQVDRLAKGLQNIGIKKGDRISILGKNCFEYFLLYGAAAAIGAIVLPINWRLSKEEIAFNIKDCEPKILFVDDEYQKTIDEIRAELGFVERYFNLRVGKGNFSDIESLMDNQGDLDTEDIKTDDSYVIIHTAAVGGRPRGAVLSHGNVLFASLQFDYFFPINKEDVHLSILPFFHVGGLFLAMSAFMAGAMNVSMSKFDAQKATQLIEEKGVTFMFTFSPILASILEEHEKSGRDISSLRAVAGIDTPQTIEKYQSVTGGTFYCMYGQTETSCVATFGPYNERPGSAGKAIPFAEVRLVDDYDRPVPVGKVGEIVVKGPMVFKGYWNLPQENEYTFRDGWHHTGDLGRFDEDGFLFYAGRKEEKELIKPGGENVYPEEVEKVILQHPAIERVVVFGVPDPKWKEGIKAVCQLRSGQTLNEKELIEFVGQRIARYKKPQYVEFVEEIPLLDDGRPDRKKVKKMYGAIDY